MSYPKLRDSRRRIPLAVSVAVIVLVGLILLYRGRADHPVLFYYQRSPEVGQRTAFAILNPFRNRKDERNAEWLIRDLRTGKCEEIVLHRLASDPARICPVMRQNTRASLIWLDAEPRNGISPSIRDLWYELPESNSKLVIHFGTSAVGWGVNTIELLH